MTARTKLGYSIALHPIQMILLASMLPLFAGGLLSDLAYSSSYEIQWSNFAAWLIAGAMVFAGISLLWAVVDLVRSETIARRSVLFPLLLGLVFVLGLFNSFVHARDAWAVMPQGLILSIVVTVLAVVATWASLKTSSIGGRA